MPKFSRNLEQSLHRALALANERHHEYATLEHLLLALVDDEDAAPVMRACNVDIEKLRRGLETYVQSRGSKPPGVVLRQLTEEERTARALALAESKVNEAEERRLAEEAGRPEVVDAEALLQFFAEESGAHHGAAEIAGGQGLRRAGEVIQITNWRCLRVRSPPSESAPDHFETKSDALSMRTYWSLTLS